MNGEKNLNMISSMLRNNYVSNFFQTSLKMFQNMSKCIKFLAFSFSQSRKGGGLDMEVYACLQICFPSARALGVIIVRASQSRGVCKHINEIIELHLLSTSVICSEATWVGRALTSGQRHMFKQLHDIQRMPLRALLKWFGLTLYGLQGSSAFRNDGFIT